MRSSGTRLQTPETRIEFSTLRANGISTPDTKSDNRVMNGSRSTGGLSMRSPAKEHALTPVTTNSRSDDHIAAARDLSPTVRSLRSQISSMHGQAQRQAGTGAGPLAQIDPLVPSLKVTNGKIIRRPPATADTHRADISALRDRDPAPRMWSNMATTAPRASQTWWCADGAAAGAESSGSKDGKEPAQNLGFVGGQKPSNRSEAVVLSQSLQELLSAHRDDQHAQQHDHDSVFTELVRQVGLHCAERGALLERLRAFYVEKARGFNALCSKRQLAIPELDAALKLQRLREQHGQQTARLRSVEKKLARMPKDTYAVRYGAGAGLYSDDNEPPPPAKPATRGTPAAAAAAAAVAAAAGTERAAAATVLTRLGAMGREQLLLVARGALDALPPAARHSFVLEQAADLPPGRDQEQLLAQQMQMMGAARCLGAAAQQLDSTEQAGLYCHGFARLKLEHRVECFQALMHVMPKDNALQACRPRRATRNSPTHPSSSSYPSTYPVWRASCPCAGTPRAPLTRRVPTTHQATEVLVACSPDAPRTMMRILSRSSSQTRQKTLGNLAKQLGDEDWAHLLASRPELASREQSLRAMSPGARRSQSPQSPQRSPAQSPQGDRPGKTGRD